MRACEVTRSMDASNEAELAEHQPDDYARPIGKKRHESCPPRCQSSDEYEKRGFDTPGKDLRAGGHSDVRHARFGEARERKPYERVGDGRRDERCPPRYGAESTVDRRFDHLSEDKGSKPRRHICGIGIVHRP